MALTKINVLLSIYFGAHILASAGNSTHAIPPSIISDTSQTQPEASSMQWQTSTASVTQQRATASSTNAPLPIPSSPSMPSNTGFVIALVGGVCGMIALLLGTGVVGYCLLLSRRAKAARARRELRKALSMRTRSDEQDSGTSTAEPTFKGSGSSSGSRVNSGTNSKYELDQGGKEGGDGRRGGYLKGPSSESEYRAAAATGGENIPMEERGAAIAGRRSPPGPDGEGITLTVTKAESYV